MNILWNFFSAALEYLVTISFHFIENRFYFQNVDSLLKACGRCFKENSWAFSCYSFVVSHGQKVSHEMLEQKIIINIFCCFFFVCFRTISEMILFLYTFAALVMYVFSFFQ